MGRSVAGRRRGWDGFGGLVTELWDYLCGMFMLLLVVIDHVRLAICQYRHHSVTHLPLETMSTHPSAIAGVNHTYVFYHRHQILLLIPSSVVGVATSLLIYHHRRFVICLSRVANETSDNVMNHGKSNFVRLLLNTYRVNNTWLVRLPGKMKRDTQIIRKTNIETWISSQNHNRGGSTLEVPPSNH